MANIHLKMKAESLPWKQGFSLQPNTEQTTLSVVYKYTKSYLQVMQSFTACSVEQYSQPVTYSPASIVQLSWVVSRRSSWGVCLPGSCSLSYSVAWNHSCLPKRHTTQHLVPRGLNMERQKISFPGVNLICSMHPLSVALHD